MPLNDCDIDFLRTVVAKRSGNVISNSQGYLLESRLTPVAVSLGLKTVEQLVMELRRDSRTTLEDRVAEAMTINETSFFRDMHPFEALRTHILPALINARKSTKQINIWCAASSSGQEPYSIAITIREHFPVLNDWKVSVYATDLSDEILAKAKEGNYTQFEVNRGLPARLLVKYFDRQGANWKVQPSIRQLVEFRKLNLSTPWPFIPRCDVIFIRNVMIYFDTPSKLAILQRIRKTIADDGYLFLGGGETLINLNTPYQREAIGETVCYRPA